MVDSNTTITSGNASSVVKSSYDDVNNALENLLGNINISGSSSDSTPVWVPQPCPFANAPAGYILANGASFSASQYPQLGTAFPSGKVPDLRGLFIRGLDTTGTVDIDGATRGILSFQEGSLLPADPVWGNISAITGFEQWNSTRENIGYEKTASSHLITIANVTNQSVQESNNTNYGVARPKNMAWNYVFRAA